MNFKELKRGMILHSSPRWHSQKYLFHIRGVENNVVIFDKLSFTIPASVFRAEFNISRNSSQWNSPKFIFYGADPADDNDLRSLIKHIFMDRLVNS